MVKLIKNTKITTDVINDLDVDIHCNKKNIFHIVKITILENYYIRSLLDLLGYQVIYWMILFGHISLTYLC